MLKGVGDPPRTRRLLLTAAFAIAALLATPSSGQGAQIFGSNLTSASNRVIDCNGSCSVWHSHLSVANTANSVFAPMTGVVTSFTLKKQAGNWPFIHLRVAIPLGGAPSPWRGGARSADVLPTNAAGTQTFPTSLPVTAGDFVALSGGNGNLHAGSNNAATAALEAQPSLPANGAPANPTLMDDLEVLAQYAVEADADGDGFGDETRDKCAGKKGPVAGCPAKKKCKKRKSKGKHAADVAKKKKCKKRKKQ